MTKYNRTCLGLEKAHWLDAACVGASTPETLTTVGVRPFLITATGHGNRQMAGLNKYGFPIRHRQRVKRHFGFQTGDIVRAVVTTGTKQGVYIGRVAVRASGAFNITTASAKIQGLNHRFFHAIQRADSYSYTYKVAS
jgi:hypothetical protein